VKLLLADSKRRRRFQLATVYEKRTNELLAEVLDTGFGPVVVYSAPVGGVLANPKQRTVGQGVPLHFRQHRTSRVAPLTGEPGQVLAVMSRTNIDYALTGADLIRVSTGDADRRTFRFTGDDNQTLTFRSMSRKAG
jgi:hypothetical protein